MELSTVGGFHELDLGIFPPPSRGLAWRVRFRQAKEEEKKRKEEARRYRKTIGKW
jgi:hypothetical protein